jgi:hypothetical protein
MDERKLKSDFALALIKTPGDPHQAAFSVIDDPSDAMAAAKRWPSDPFVLSEIERFKADGHGIDNPDKEQQAYEIYKLATQDGVSVEDKLRAHRLYAEIKGHIERPTINNGIINNTNKVMQVAIMLDGAGNPVSENEWENAAERSQKMLQGDGMKTLEGRA